MQQLMEDLNEMEKAFFVPLNAHPLKKVNDGRDTYSLRDNDSELGSISNSE